MDKKIIDKVFKNYDIRGIADTEITEEFAYAVGNAFAQRNNLTTCVVGRDGRQSSPKLTKAVIAGLVDAGVAVTDADIVSTPQIKWIVPEYDFDGGIMVSASHNPAEYNGFKLLENGKPSLGQDSGLWELKEYLHKPKKVSGGTVEKKSYLDAFIDSLLQTLSASNVPVFIDPSGGVASPEIKRLMEKGDFNFTLFNAEIDPEFRVHPPNPLDESALEAAEEFCGMNKCLGVVLDADADRIVFIDEEGHSVAADFFGAWLATKLLEKGEGASATVRDSRALKNIVEEDGGTFYLSKVGHANVQAVLMEHGLTLGIEKSGHIFFKQSYYAENTLLCLLLTLKQLDGKRLADEVKFIRESYMCANEHNYHVRDKEAVLAAVKEHYATRGTLNLMDGILCEGDDWWVNIRPSNTEPLLRLTWEARDSETYKDLKDEAVAIIQPFIVEK